MKADPVRRLAHEILIAVAEGQPLDSTLAVGLEKSGGPRQRAFLAELVRGTLQWQGRYDYLIARFCRRKPPSDVPTLALLRMSLHQLIGQDSIPAYAAIHQAGELCRHRPGVGKLPFVNGLLQRVRREVLGQAEESDMNLAAREERLRSHFAAGAGDRSEKMAAWHSHPAWLVGKWGANYGWSRAEAICDWNNRPVPLAFHVLNPFDPRDAAGLLEAAGCPVIPGRLERTLIAAGRLGRPALDDILARFPWLIVQDPTIQEAVSWLVGEPGRELQAGDSPVLDMCAAPGGKTAFLASRMPASGRVVAMDLKPERVDLLAGTRKRIEAERVDVLLADGTRPPFGPGTFGAVLVDGPCSGTGVLRRHPEGRWRLKPTVPSLKGRILKVLAEQAADLVRPGGLVLYATCSIEPEENQEVVDGLLAERADLEPAPVGEGSWRRLWLPGEARGDGFFAARLRKKG